MNSSLQKRIIYFYKLAKDTNNAAPSIEKLKTDRFFDSSLWFSKFPTISNLEENFGMLDKKLKDELGSDYIYSIHYDKLKDFILDSFNSTFKRFKLNSVKVSELLEDQESTNLFILIHDLIHQVFQRNFTESIQSQSVDIDDDPDYYIPLMDRLYEDAASSLSNFQPQKSQQGIFTYLEDLFRINYGNYDVSENGLKNLINEVFKIAKNELRSQKDNKFKQFADGFLSKLKGQMLDTHNFNYVINKVTAKNSLEDVWDLYGLQESNEDAYYERLDDSSLLDEEKAILLRNWLMACIKKTNELLDNLNDEEIYD